MEDKHSKNGWDRIGGVRSESNPTKFYVVALRTSGYLGCDCPSWVYRKGTQDHGGFKNTCKHQRALIDESIALKDLDLTTFGLNWLAKRAAARADKSATVAKVG